MKCLGYNFRGEPVFDKGQIIGLDFNGYPIYENEPSHVLVNGKLKRTLDLTCGNYESMYNFRKLYKDK